MLTINGIQAIFLGLWLWIVTGTLHSSFDPIYLGVAILGAFVSLCGADLLNNWLVDRLNPKVQDTVYRG